MTKALERIAGDLAQELHQVVGDPISDPRAERGVAPRRIAADAVHEHVALLANAIGAIGSLVLDRRIPPAIEMHHMRSAREIEPGAAGLDRENEKRRALVFLKRLDEVAAFGDRRVAMK